MATKRPHILLITADELRKDALSCYGNKAVQTPNLDRLADEGIKFNKGYTVSPWCLPARCSILTGLYPHNTGSYSNIRECPLGNDIPNLFKELRGSGYTTSLFGKCHFAPVPYDIKKPDETLPYDEFREYYVSLGLDHLDLQDDKQVSVWFYDDYAKELDEAGYLKAYRDETWSRDNAKVFPFPAPAEWHPDSWVGRKTVEFIDKYDSDKPLFSWVSFSGPHYPMDTPEEYMNRVDMSKDTGMKAYEGEFDSPGRIHYTSYHGDGVIDGSAHAPGKGCKNYTPEYWEKLRKRYLANMALIDDEVGKIIEAAKRKFGDNILIIFTADHGDMLGNHGIWGKSNCAYEDVWNVPMIVKYPNEKSEIISDAKVMGTDILATCLKAAGVRAIESDGMDFKENLEQGGYKYVFAEGEGYIAVSNGTVKYVLIDKRRQKFEELIDMSNDPDETRNIIDDPAYSAKLAELRGEINKLFLKKLMP